MEGGWGGYLGVGDDVGTFLMMWRRHGDDRDDVGMTGTMWGQ